METALYAVVEPHIAITHSAQIVGKTQKEKMNNIPLPEQSTGISGSLIKWIMGGMDKNKWFEDNKREFIKKNNPKYYETLYGNKNNQKEGEGN